jgi:hypothetical protein
MPTNNNINYGPTPLPGTVTTPVLGNNIDRAPAAVPPGAGTGVNPASTAPVIPVVELPVATDPPSSRTVIPVTAAAVDLTGGANTVSGPNLTAGNQQRYITILANGTVVTNNATTLNFTGNGVSVSALGTTGANIVITAGNGGGGDYSNSNVSSFLASFGSNTLSTTGNITGGNILGNIQAPDGDGSIIFNRNGFLGAAAGFNYQANTGTLFANSITGSGNAITGTGAIYGGLGSYTQLGTTVLGQFTGNVNSYAQLNIQNINSGNNSSADYIITADNGTDTTHYVDLGLAGSNHADPAFFGDTSTANDGYLYVTGTDQAGPSNGTGNLILGSTNGTIKMFVGNTAQANVKATVNSAGLSVNGNIVANGTVSATAINLTSTGTAINAGSGNILTNKVTGTQFAFLNGLYTAVLTGGGATANYTMNLPANVGSDGQVLSSDGTGNLIWTTGGSGGVTNKIANGNSFANVEFPSGNLAVGINLQNVTGAWINTYGNIVINDQHNTVGESVIVDEGGNVYVTGSVFNNDFDEDQAFVRKLNSDGVVMWQKALPEATDGSGSSSGESLAIDNAGNLYWLANLWGGSIQDGSAFVVKMNSSTGESVWSTLVQGGQYAQDITVSGAGQVFVTCDENARITSLDASGTVLWSFDPGNGGASLLDLGTFVLVGYQFGTVGAYNYDGDLLWVNQVFNTNNEVWGLASDGTNWYAADRNGYIMKISGSDNSTILWQKYINRDGSGGNLSLTWIEYSDGYIYMGGTGVDINDNDALITVKISASDGSLTWARGLEATGGVGQWYWYGHQDLAVSGSSYLITGYAHPAQSNANKQVLARLPTDGTLVGSTVGPYRYIDLPALTVEDSDVGGDGYNGSPSQPSTVTTTHNYALNALVAPYAEENILSPFTTGPIWSFNSDGNLVVPGSITAITDNSLYLSVNNNGGGPGLGLYNWDVANGAPTTYLSVDTDNVSIVTNVIGAGSQHEWKFAVDGSLVPPTQPSNDRTGSGLTLKIGDTNNQAIITGPSPVANTFNNAPRLVIAGQDGVLDGEGGDIYLWAGQSGNIGGSGGDIKVDAGIGQNGSDGGTIKVRGGNSVGGTGGFIEIDGGYGAVGGPIYITGGGGNGGAGGEITLLGGSASTGFTGGNVTITGGTSADGLASYGNVKIAAGASLWTFDNTGQLTVPNNSTIKPISGTIGIATNDGNTYAWASDGGFYIDTAYNTAEYEWNFDPTGNLNLPQGGIIYETAIPGGTLSGSTIALKPYGGTSADQQLLIYPTAGNVDANHLHLTSGNLWNTELFLGNDNLYVKLANTGDVVINSNDGGSNTAQWSFGTDGNLAVPGNTLIYTPIATGGAGGKNISIQAGSSDSFASAPGGNLNLTGGYGSFGDGGGPPGGNVNIISGGSYDSHAGNVNITTGSNNWTFDYTGKLNLPTVSLSESTDEQTVISSQRKLIPPFRWSALITGSTPTVVYTVTNSNTTSMKVTMQVQHNGLGMEFFEVFATFTGPDTWYTVNNRLSPPTIAASTVVVNLNGSNGMQITVTSNSGADTCWVTYDAVEFGISVD